LLGLLTNLNGLAQYPSIASQNNLENTMSNNQASHTPTPNWAEVATPLVIDTDNRGCIIVRDSRGDIVIFERYPNDTHDGKDSFYEAMITRTRANFHAIVRAVNSHAQLVAALHSVFRGIEHEVASGGGIFSDKQLTKARAALAAARE
jgi:hypothetical protein